MLHTRDSGGAFGVTSVKKTSLNAVLSPPLPLSLYSQFPSSFFCSIFPVRYRTSKAGKRMFAKLRYLAVVEEHAYTLSVVDTSNGLVSN